MPRTDFSSEIDGALATRNLGSRHFSEIARSGNGNMLSDLSEADLADYQELDGIGEALEELGCDECAKLDGLGSHGFAPLRFPKAGEAPPFSARPGQLWMRRRVLTGTRRPGGGHVARVKWVQMTPARLQEAQQQGSVAGMGSFGIGAGISVGVGLVLGIGAYLLLRRK